MDSQQAVLSPESADRPATAPTTAMPGDAPGEAPRLGAGSAPAPARGLGYWDLLYLGLFSVAALLVVSVVCVAVYFGLGYFLEWEMDFSQASSQAGIAITIQALASVLVLAFMYTLITVKYELPFGAVIGWRPIKQRPLFYGASYCGAGVLLAFTVGLASHVMSMPEQPTPFEDLLRDPSSLLLVAGFGIAIAPLVEELIFRGFVFSVFERAHGRLAAVVITAGSFSLIHGPQYGWHWQILVLLLYVGIVFGAVRAKTRSIVPSTIIHAAYNTTLLIGLLSASQAPNGA